MYNFNTEVIRVFPIPLPSKDSHCVTPSRSHQISLDFPSKFLKQFGITLTTEFCQYSNFKTWRILTSQGKLSKILNLQQRSRIYFPRQQSRVLLSPAIKDLFSSARQLISLHAHTLHSYIKHIYCIIHFMQHNFVFQLTFYPFQDKINKLPLTVYNHDTV